MRADIACTKLSVVLLSKFWFLMKYSHSSSHCPLSSQQYPEEAAEMKDLIFLACPQIRFISVQKVYSDKNIILDTNMLKCSNTYSLEAFTSDYSRKERTM